MIDNQGRIKGRVSIVDIIIVLAIVALVAGLIYRQATPHLADILRPDDEFYVTFEVRRMRDIIVDNSVEIGDVLFRQHDRSQPLGTIVAIERFPATDILPRTDGTAVLATMEQRYNLHITIAAIGTVAAGGYFVNGVDHMAPGSEIALINNRVIFPFGRVYSVGDVRP